MIDISQLTEIQKAELSNLIEDPPQSDFNILSELLQKKNIPFIITNHGKSGMSCKTLTTRHHHAIDLGLRVGVFVMIHEHNEKQYNDVYTLGGSAEDMVNRIGACVFSHERPLRFNILSDLLSDGPGVELMSTQAPNKLAELIISVYIDAEIFDQEFADQWHQLLVEHRDLLKNDMLRCDYTNAVLQDRSFEADGEQWIHLYHGIEFDADPETYVPRSWTLNQKTAEFFSSRFSSKKKSRGVMTCTLPVSELKQRAIFYTDARSESEVYIPDGMLTSQTQFIMRNKQIRSKGSLHRRVSIEDMHNNWKAD
jgi:hypothetical protein